MKEIHLKYIKQGKCSICKEPDSLYLVSYKGKKVGICSLCLEGYFLREYPNLTERESGKNLILEI